MPFYGCMLHMHVHTYLCVLQVARVTDIIICPALYMAPANYCYGKKV